MVKQTFHQETQDPKQEETLVGALKNGGPCTLKRTKSTTLLKPNGGRVGVKDKKNQPSSLRLTLGGSEASTKETCKEGKRPQKPPVNGGLSREKTLGSQGESKAARSVEHRKKRNRKIGLLTTQRSMVWSCPRGGNNRLSKQKKEQGARGQVVNSL